MNKLRAILAQKCPRCLDGKAFQSLWKMYPNCPRCGLLFEREPGFFLGSMYYSYGIGVFAVAPLCVALYLLDYSVTVIGVSIFAELILLSPLLFRYSRVLWMHMDQKIDPR